MAQTDHHEHQHAADTVCPSCDIGPFSRNNYFTGKLMLERDFTDETRYHIDKLRHHHQRLHGWGVVCGLKVKQHEQEKCRNRFVCIEPGTAIDCCGHEIIVREEECIDIMQFEAIKELEKREGEMQQKPPHTLQIRICYRECPTEEIPVLYDECGCDDTKCAPNRILESYDFDVILDPPKPPDRPRHEDCKDILWDSLKGCPHCDIPECIVLAEIKKYRIRDKIVDANIDNKVRKLLPSTETLLEYIECRGGTGGTEEAGIDDVNLKIVDCDKPASATIITDNVTGKRILELIIPTSCQTDLTHICGINWQHNGKEESREIFHDPGLLIAFDKSVHRQDLLDSQSLIVLAWRKEEGGELMCWCEVPGTIEPGDFETRCDIRSGFRPSANPQVTGVRFRSEIEIDDRRLGREFRVILKGDFIRGYKDKGLDADHLPPWFNQPNQPNYVSGDGVEGGTFESWFSIKG